MRTPSKNYLTLLLLTLVSLIHPLRADKELPSEMRIGAQNASLEIAFGCVNVMTGDLVCTDVALQMEGPFPYTYTHSYDSGWKYRDTICGYGCGADFPFAINKLRLYRTCFKNWIWAVPKPWG